MPPAGWLPLEHTQPLEEEFSNMAQPAHSQVTAPGVTGRASPPTLQQNLGGIWEHACSWLLMMSVE